MTAIAKLPPASFLRYGKHIKEEETDLYHAPHGHDEMEPERRVDLTSAIPIHSKRTERRRKKLEKKTTKKHTTGFVDLPSDHMLRILCFLPARDVFTLTRVCKGLRSFILWEPNTRYIGEKIIGLRYPILTKCFPLPVFLEKVDPAAHEALLNPDRAELETIFRKPFQHIQPLDVHSVCSCLTCLHRWNSLCVAVDFAHWQDHLDNQEPIPLVPRGTNPAWNSNLVSRNAALVIKAMKNRLWYAAILGRHLRTTIRSIRRHSQNKADDRRHFIITDDDINAETDSFLQRPGSQTTDLAYHRDNYYMLEAYLPNRGWIQDHNEWWYVNEGQHEYDVAIIVRWHPYRSVRRST